MAAYDSKRVRWGVAWIHGGFDTARPGDLRTSNSKDVRWAWVLDNPFKGAD
jgi:hypothetical protein